MTNCLLRTQMQPGDEATKMSRGIYSIIFTTLAIQSVRLTENGTSIRESGSFLKTSPSGRRQVTQVGRRTVDPLAQACRESAGSVSPCTTSGASATP